MITIKRTGQRPLQFDGEQLAETSTRNYAGKERNRWHELGVWKTHSGKFVVAVAYHTQWQGEAEYDDACTFDSLPDVATFLEEYIFPNIGTVGYPASPTYADRQARVMGELEQAFKEAASILLGKLGVAEII